MYEPFATWVLSASHSTNTCCACPSSPRDIKRICALLQCWRATPCTIRRSPHRPSLALNPAAHTTSIASTHAAHHTRPFLPEALRRQPARNSLTQVCGPPAASAPRPELPRPCVHARALELARVRQLVCGDEGWGGAGQVVGQLAHALRCERLPLRHAQAAPVCVATTRYLACGALARCSRPGVHTGGTTAHVWDVQHLHLEQ